MFKFSTTAGVVAIAVLASGCAGFRANNLPVVSQQDLAINNTAKPKVFTKWVVTPNSNDPGSVAGAAMHKKSFEDALARSSCCTVVDDAGTADLVVNGTTFNEFNAAATIPAFITGFTFGVIPSWATINTHIAVDAKRGDVSRNYDLKDSMTMVQWLPMLLVMPFTGNGITVGNEVEQNLYNNLIVKLKGDGLLK